MKKEGSEKNRKKKRKRGRGLKKLFLEKGGGPREKSNILKKKTPTQPLTQPLSTGYSGAFSYRDDAVVLIYGPDLKKQKTSRSFSGVGLKKSLKKGGGG